jgi:hypothetical protein
MAEINRMGMGKGIFNGLTDGAKALLVIVGLLGLLALTLIIYFIVIGAFSYQVQSGNLPVTNATNTSIQSVESDFDTVRSNVSTAQVIILGFVGLVVILAIVAGIGLLRGMKKKGSGGADF